MKFELNIVPDKPTINNRVYKLEDLKEIFQKVDIPVSLFPSKNGVVKIEDILGFANLSEINSEVVEFEVKIIKTGYEDVIKDKQLSPSIIGDVKRVDIKDECGLITESNNVVFDMILVGLYVVQETNMARLNPVGRVPVLKTGNR